METVPEFISSIIMKIFPTEIAYGIIIVGFLIFFLYFYGTKEWESFSDLVKIILSIATGWLLWSILIFPISMGIENLKLFFTYTTDLNIYNKSINNFYVYSVYIVAYFLGWRLTSNTPLFYDKRFVKVTTSLIRISILLLYPPLFFLLFSFYFSGYINFATYSAERIAAVMVLLLALYFIFLKIHGNLKLNFENKFLDKLDNYLHSKINSISSLKIKHLLILILIASAMGSAIGYLFYNSSIENEEVTKVRLDIPALIIDQNSDKNFSGSLLIEDQFEIKFGWIKWVYISKNFTIKEASNKDDSLKKFNFSGNFVVLSGDKKANVTLIGNQEITVDKDFYNVEKEYSDNAQIWNISFNRKEYEIMINEIIVRPPKNSKLISYKTYGLAIYKERLDEQLNKSANSFIVNKVEIPTVRYNDGTNIYKISLYFIENK